MDYQKFPASSGTVGETFIATCSQPAEDFATEAHALLESCRAIFAGRRPLYWRFHLSDIANQAEPLRKLLGDDANYVLMVGQPPTGGSRLATTAWLLDAPQPVIRQQTENGSSTEQALSHYHLFTFRRPRLQSTTSEDQMREEFQALRTAIVLRNGTLADHVHRTWIYCRDVDNHYAGLVKGRRDFFREEGLTEKTHYITSTGIEALAAEPARLVQMESLALWGLRPEQVIYLRAPEYLSPTHVYGVTFERGVRILFGDRSWLHLSGTASIDKEGHIVHPGNIRLQVRRMVENFSALLHEGEGSLNDLKIAAVYLRDAADAPAVEEILSELLPPTVPRIMVKAPVCRPGWLVEMEGVAVHDHGDPRFQPLG